MGSCMGLVLQNDIGLMDNIILLGRDQYRFRSDLAEYGIDLSAILFIWQR